MRKAPLCIVPILAIGVTYGSSDAAPSESAAAQLEAFCPPRFTRVPFTPIPFGHFVDRNQNGFVCIMQTPAGVVTIDDIDP